jgi:hypothetical protein
MAGFQHEAAEEGVGHLGADTLAQHAGLVDPGAVGEDRAAPLRSLAVGALAIHRQATVAGMGRGTGQLQRRACRPLAAAGQVVGTAARQLVKGRGHEARVADVGADEGEGEPTGRAGFHRHLQRRAGQRGQADLPLVQLRLAGEERLHGAVGARALAPVEGGAAASQRQAQGHVHGRCGQGLAGELAHGRDYPGRVWRAGQSRR